MEHISTVGCPYQASGQHRMADTQSIVVIVQDTTRIVHPINSLLQPFTPVELLYKLLCRNVDMLHLASNIRYVFECHEWLNKKCKNERILMKPWVQYPPTQMQDWRVTEVYPAQVHRRAHTRSCTCTPSIALHSVWTSA